MLCGFFTVEAGGEESENGALRVGDFARQRGLRGSSLFTGMRWGGRDFAKRWGVQSGASAFSGLRWGGRDFAGWQVFPILWYKGAAACAYYSLKRR